MLNFLFCIRFVILTGAVFKTISKPVGDNKSTLWSLKGKEEQNVNLTFETHR